MCDNHVAKGNREKVDSAMLLDFYFELRINVITLPTAVVK